VSKARFSKALRVPVFESEYCEALEAIGKIEGLNGVSIGRKLKDGRLTDELCVKFRVAKKVHPSKLKASELLPSTIGKANTDVVSGIPRLCADLWTGRYPVVQPGMSVSGFTTLGLAGSFGPVVVDDTDGWYGILTAWHVLSSGTTADAYAIHPGSASGGSGPYDSIGTVARTLIDLHGDAALIRLSRQPAGAPLGAHYIFRSVKNAEIGDSLMKSGRQTELTTGEVTGIGSQTLNYSDWGLGSLNITCLEIQPNSGDTAEEIVKSGDSGSAWWIPSTEELCGMTLGHVVGDPFTALAMDVSAALYYLECDIPAVTDLARADVGTFNVANRRSKVQVGTTLVCDTGTFLGVQVSAYENEETTYATIDEFAAAKGYADGDEMLTAFGFESGQEDDFAVKCGYVDLAALLAAQTMSSLEQVLSDAGVTFE
jgi:hypothetical protein